MSTPAEVRTRSGVDVSETAPQQVGRGVGPGAGAPAAPRPRPAGRPAVGAPVRDEVDRGYVLRLAPEGDAAPFHQIGLPHARRIANLAGALGARAPRRDLLLGVFLRGGFEARRDDLSF